MNTAQRARLIRAATPDVLEELFEQQNRICDLCGQPMQDLIVATVEHSVSVMVYARGPLSIKEATQQCNALGNLRAAHGTCNTAKKDKTREEWFARGLDKLVGTPRLLTDVELLELQFRMGAGGRTTAEKGLGCHAPGVREKAGGKGGRAAQATLKKKGLGFYNPETQRKATASQKENGTGFYDPAVQRRAHLNSNATNKKNGTGLYDPKVREKGRRSGSVKGGRTNAINGTGVCGLTLKQLQAAQRKGAVTNKKNGTGLYDPEVCRKGQRIGCRIGWRACKEKGLGIYGMTHEQHVAAGRIAGRASVAVNRKNGTGIFDPRTRRKANRAAQATQKKNGTGVYNPETGRKGGVSNVINKTGFCSPGMQAKGQQVMTHNRWHVARGIVNPKCKLCRATA